MLRIITLVTTLLLSVVGLLGVVAFCAVPASAQEHDHGQGGLPDWYDPSCCNQRDCRPVKDDKDIEFVQLGGSDFVRHLPTGLLFQRSQWKVSQDERYHVWIHNDNAEGVDNVPLRPLCVYIRAGA